MTERSDTAVDPATEAWTIVMDILFGERPPRVPAVAAEFDMSPVGLRLLNILEPGLSLPMSQLAAECSCDASNVTGIVDRMEARGLVERSADPADRRVKRIALSESGRELREAVIRRLNEAPAALAALPRPEQEALRDILRRAVAGD